MGTVWQSNWYYRFLFLYISILQINEKKILPFLFFPQSGQFSPDKNLEKQLVFSLSIRFEFVNPNFNNNKIKFFYRNWQYIVNLIAYI